MNYYVISPNVTDNRSHYDAWVKLIQEKNCAFMGYDTEHGIGLKFSQIKKDDFILIAQGINKNKRLFLCGLVDKESAYNIIDDMPANVQGIKLRNTINQSVLECLNLDFSGCALGNSRPKALYQLYPETNANDHRIVNTLLKEINAMKLKTDIYDLLEKNKNLILTGAPGAGKTYLAKELAKLITQTEDNSSQITSVQFHPSYDYSDFIEGLKPKISNGQMEFEPKAGVFKSFCEIAEKPENKDKKYAFIIDEINRADLSRVFGEAFSLLEESYRGELIETQYSYITGNKFTIPENIYIIGTMNDVDRSVESMDFALRRRFAWREISAKDSESIIDVADIDQQWKVEAKKRMSSLNDKIAEILESTSYQIGGAYYKKLEKYKASNDLTEAFKQLWNNHIAVLLHEYLRGIPKSKEKFEEMKKAFDA
jgi:5-methylcytosine-specific restriction endonuclease McrBC GTP-binding regulatory subunit McrB